MRTQVMLSIGIRMPQSSTVGLLIGGIQIMPRPGNKDHGNGMRAVHKSGGAHNQLVSSQVHTAEGAAWMSSTCSTPIGAPSQYS